MYLFRHKYSCVAFNDDPKNDTYEISWSLFYFHNVFFAANIFEKQWKRLAKKEEEEEEKNAICLNSLIFNWIWYGSDTRVYFVSGWMRERGRELNSVSQYISDIRCWHNASTDYFFYFRFEIAHTQNHFRNRTPDCVAIPALNRKTFSCGAHASMRLLILIMTIFNNGICCKLCALQHYDTIAGSAGWLASSYGFDRERKNGVAYINGERWQQSFLNAKVLMKNRTNDKCGGVFFMFIFIFGNRFCDIVLSSVDGLDQ